MSQLSHLSPLEFKIENGVVRECTGQGLIKLLQAGTRWLEIHHDVVNRLNVFPVPDGDTGTNMLLTMRSALAEIEAGQINGVGSTAKAAAHGAIMGGRGNSGVILSQFWLGMAEALQGKNTFTAEDLAIAVQSGSQQAARSVAGPVEGTILTVARAMAEAAQSSAAQNQDIVLVVADSLKAATIAQLNTPELLPILKEAGVTDSGGQGLVYIFEGWLRFLCGDSLTPQSDPFMPATLGVSQNLGNEGVQNAFCTPKIWDVPATLPGLKVEEKHYGYDVQFLIQGEGLDAGDIRAKIDRMGRSTVVVGDENVVKVHVHAENPQAVLDCGATIGNLSHIVVESLDRQAEKFIKSVMSPPQNTGQVVSGQAVIAVAAGWGMAEVFQSLGVSRIVPGGQTMNPSIEELLACVNQVEAKDVLILPNNSNIILAARQAQQLSTKNVRVIPTTTIPQGVAALVAFNQARNLDVNVERMAQAAQQVRTVEITPAGRNSQVNGFTVCQGDLLGLVDGELKSVGQDDIEVARGSLAHLDLMDAYEIITIYYGQECTENRANSLARQLETLCPDFEVEVIYGGQPHYHFIISVE